MKEAMDDQSTDDDDDDTKDSKTDSCHSCKSPKRELFLFPDDQPDLQKEVEDAMEGLAVDGQLSINDDDDDNDEDDSDDEFCILDHPDREPEVDIFGIRGGVVKG